LLTHEREPEGLSVSLPNNAANSINQIADLFVAPTEVRSPLPNFFLEPIARFALRHAQRVVLLTSDEQGSMKDGKVDKDRRNVNAKRISVRG
jgi:hypothetical protein